MSGLVTPLVNRPRVVGLTGIALASAAAWLALGLLDPLDGGIGIDLIRQLCSVSGPGATAYWPVAAMWLLMCVAMMLPTAAPAVDLYIRLAGRMERFATLHIAAFVAGYLAIWGAFGLAAAAIQIALTPLTTAPGQAGLAFAGGLLVLAGGYQLSALKRACLTKCRNPMAFFMAEWREGPDGAVFLGLRHGLICVGCCWALMLLMLIAGAMNPFWMATLGLAMLAEKSLPRADEAGRVFGFFLLAAGGGLLVAGLV